MMRLYFLRHGDALGGYEDALRPLSDRGNCECEKIGSFLKKEKIDLDAVFASPLVRAQQTARRVLDYSGNAHAISLQIEKVLLNETADQDFYVWQSQLKGFKHVLLVGHAPSLASRARTILGCVASIIHSLPTCGMICLEKEVAASKFIFFITPEDIH